MTSHPGGVEALTSRWESRAPASGASGRGLLRTQAAPDVGSGAGADGAERRPTTSGGNQQDEQLANATALSPAAPPMVAYPVETVRPTEGDEAGAARKSSGEPCAICLEHVSPSEWSGVSCTFPPGGCLAQNKIHRGCLANYVRRERAAIVRDQFARDIPVYTLEPPVRCPVCRRPGEFIPTIDVDCREEHYAVRKEEALDQIRWESGFAIKNFPEDLRADRDVVIFALQHCDGYDRLDSVLKFVSNELRADREVVMIALQDRPEQAFPYVSDELRADRDLVLLLVRAGRDPFILKELAGELRRDREVVLAAVSQNGWAIQFAPEELRADQEIVEAAVAQWGGCLGKAAPELRANPDVVRIALRSSGLALLSVAEELLADRGVVMAAVEQLQKEENFPSVQRTLEKASEELQDSVSDVRGIADKIVRALRESAATHVRALRESAIRL